jgi:hypothetical protein
MYIDLSDQQKAYNTSLRRGIKWYKKLAMELLLGTTIGNAHILYNEITKRKITITKFKEEILEIILHRFSKKNPMEEDPAEFTHIGI